MFLEDLKKIKDNELLTRFSQVVQKEREAIATVVFYLSEIARRKLYLEEAYSSLFSFVTQKFHYSEGAAYRRIQASKVVSAYPEVLGLLSEGKVSLITLSLIESYLTKENAKGWVEKIVGKSKREVEFMLSELSLKKENHRDIIRRLPVFSPNPVKGDDGQEKRPAPVREVERQEKLPAPLEVPGSFSCLPLPSSDEPESAQNFSFTGGNGGEKSGEISSHEIRGEGLKEQPCRKIKIEFVAKEELAQKIERAKEILRHKFPDGKFEDIFNQALDDMLEKRDPQRKIERVNKRKLKASEGEEETRNTITKEAEGEKGDIKNSGSRVAESGYEKSFLSRYIPEGTRMKIWARDGGQCTYESSDGRRCGERNFIQLDHVHPFALGGKSTEENLRILCAKHNHWRAEKTFGKSGSG